MQELEPVSTKQNTRRTVLLGIGIMSIFSFFTMGFFTRKKNVIACAPGPDEKKTMKFLTQDGQLVEVDITKVNSLKEKASNKEMQEWVKR
ncbi:MAG: hypothetical protein K2Q21_05220 [Chitinophagaceae bacterium]|nr:hypothetical protein [Chitinophagaceae bacterium]